MNSLFASLLKNLYFWLFLVNIFIIENNNDSYKAIYFHATHAYWSPSHFFHYLWLHLSMIYFYFLEKYYIKNKIKKITFYKIWRFNFELLYYREIKASRIVLIYYTSNLTPFYNPYSKSAMKSLNLQDSYN